MRYNSEWLGKLGYDGRSGLTAHFTVSQMLDREEFLKRFQAEQPISLHELLYPVMQGYDSVALSAMWSSAAPTRNSTCCAGESCSAHYGQKPQIVLMTPILEGLDGVQKMSKSLNNAIGINEPASEMYGKLMSICDELMWKYWVLLTDLKQSEIDALMADVAAGHCIRWSKENARADDCGRVSRRGSGQSADENWARKFPAEIS